MRRIINKLLSRYLNYEPGLYRLTYHVRKWYRQADVRDASFFPILNYSNQLECHEEAMFVEETFAERIRQFPYLVEKYPKHINDFQQSMSLDFEIINAKL